MTALTLEQLDQLSLAHMVGATASPVTPFQASDLAAYFEWVWLARAGVTLGDVVPTGPMRELATHLRAQETLWTSHAASRAGFIRVTRAVDDVENIAWLSFRTAVARAAQTFGIAKPVAHSIVGALGELEGNIHDHSRRAQSGLIAYLVADTCFELVVLDRGVGVLSSLRESRESDDLIDDDAALFAAVMQHRTRHGVGTAHGTGFLPLFRGLANTNALLRFRSGNALLTLDGADRRGRDIPPRRATRPRGQGLIIATRWPR